MACTKQNPNVCCVDEADCAAQGLSNDSQCADGLLCRGNQCIAVTCGAGSDCDASAPYCVDSSCAETCTSDVQCPGFGQDSSAIHCEDAVCVECRAGHNEDCAVTSPICDAHSCRGCKAHSECASGACAADGTCVPESNIAYVDPAGSSASNCTPANPCTIARAVQLGTQFMVLSPGTHTSATTITLNGQHTLIGRGPGLPEITRSSGTGPIVAISSGELTLANLRLRGALSNTNYDDGDGVSCTSSSGASVHLLDVELVDNASNGLRAGGCTIDAQYCLFARNGVGVQMSDGNGRFDRCVATGNKSGLLLDGGLYTVTNNLIYRNDAGSNAAGYGIDIFSNLAGSRVEFNTVVDNVSSATIGAGISCNLQGVTAAWSNNIVARNTRQTQGTNCTYSSSIIVDVDIASLKFKSPDQQPYDYHLTSGSIAIDTASPSSIDIDVDGQARPYGAARDVGADEYVP